MKNFELHLLKRIASSATKSDRRFANKIRGGGWGGGQHSTTDSVPTSRQASSGSILGFPKNFSDFIEIYRQSSP